VDVARLPVRGGLHAQEQPVEPAAASLSKAVEVALLALREGLADGDGELPAEREKLAL
jgi:hypothetical protein